MMIQEHERKEKKRAYDRRYYLEHMSEIKINRYKYAALHPDKIKETHRRYYEKNKKQALDGYRKWKEQYLARALAVEGQQGGDGNLYHHALFIANQNDDYDMRYIQARQRQRVRERIQL